MTLYAWSTVVFTAAAAIIGAFALRRDRRWLALWCGVIMADSLLHYFTRDVPGARYIVGVPVLLLLFLTFKQLRAEAERTRPQT